MQAVLPPLTISMHPSDNVAIVANDGGLPAGTVLSSGLVLKDKVPQGHKVALGRFDRRCSLCCATAFRLATRSKTFPLAVGCMSACCTCLMRGSWTIYLSPPSNPRHSHP